MCLALHMVFHVTFSTENKHPPITEFPFFFSTHCLLRECVMPLIAGFYTHLMSNHSIIYFHLFLIKCQLQQKNRKFQSFFSENRIFIKREIKKANLIPSFLITATGALDQIKRDSDSLALVGEGRKKTYQQWMIVFKVDNDEIVEAVLQFLLLHLSLLIKWALSEARAHSKFNVTLFIPALNKVCTWSDDKCTKFWDNPSFCLTETCNFPTFFFFLKEWRWKIAK